MKYITEKSQRKHCANRHQASRSHKIKIHLGEWSAESQEFLTNQHFYNKTTPAKPQGKHPTPKPRNKSLMCFKSAHFQPELVKDVYNIPYQACAPNKKINLMTRVARLKMLGILCCLVAIQCVDRCGQQNIHKYEEIFLNEQIPLRQPHELASPTRKPHQPRIEQEIMSWIPN